MRYSYVLLINFFLFIFIADSVQAQKKPRVRILGEPYRVMHVSLDRSYVYNTSPVNGISTTGEERIETETLARARRVLGGFDLFFSGNASGSYAMSGDDYYEDCHQDFAVESFGSSAGINISQLTRRRFEVSAIFGTDPLQPGFESSYWDLCPDRPVGIRAYLLSSIVTGSENEECSGSEMCLQIARKRLKRQRINLTLNRTEHISDEEAVRDTTLNIRLRRVVRR